MKFQKKVVDPVEKGIPTEAPINMKTAAFPATQEPAAQGLIVRAITRISESGKKYLPGDEFEVSAERAASLVRSQAAKVVS